MSKHHLKTLPTFFQLAWDKKKPTEIRFHGDRHFTVGDQVFLHEGQFVLPPTPIPGVVSPHRSFDYSGRWIGNTILAVFQNLPGLERGYSFLVLEQVVFQDGGIDAHAVDLYTTEHNPNTPPQAGLPKGDIES